jgi:3-hydroxybutyryl-CoA dehydrogenase
MPLAIDDIKNIGVIGAGQMGSGIAQVAALAGYEVRLEDVNAAALDTAIANISKNLERQVARGKLGDGEKQAALKRIRTGSDFKPLTECDVVIEAATEREELKRDIFVKLVPALNERAIVASNTSSISITRLAASTDRPARFELIRGIATDDATFQTIRALALKLGKTPVAAEDFPAFIVNRILLPMINEAVYTLYEGVGSVEAIDTAMKLGANHPMGPLELADFIGLDTCLAVMQVLHEGLADSKYRPCPLLVKYVEAGWLGRKSSRGFYDYRGEKPVPTR